MFLTIMVARERRVLFIPHGNIRGVCMKQYVVTVNGTSSRPAIITLRFSVIAPDMFLVSGSSSTSSRQHLSVTILELSTSPGTGTSGMDSDADKLSFISSVSPGGLEPPIVMTPSGAYPERRESNNSTRSTRSYFGGGVCKQQQSRSSGSDVVLADNNSDTYGPGGELYERSEVYAWGAQDGHCKLESEYVMPCRLVSSKY
jgi:hypothetical protein